MPLITLSEAKSLLRVYDITEDADIETLIGSVAAYIKNATGHDWDADDNPNPIAQHVMRAMLVRLYDNREDVRAGVATLDYGITNWLTMLQYANPPEVSP